MNETNKYKAKIRIPKDQFAFIELDVEEELDEINMLYDKMSQQEIGLEDKEWRPVLDKYLTDGSMDSNAYERMSLKQKGLIQEIKRAFARINK
jgi:hypothetical protein